MGAAHDDRRGAGGINAPARLCWVVPDDRGGGVVSVAEACCRQAVARGHDATLLLLLAPTGHVAEYASFTIDTLDARPPYRDAPERLMRWLDAHPQDVLLFNGCDHFDAMLPFVPPATRTVYCVHDTAPRYYKAAMARQDGIDAFLAVSENVARAIRPHLTDPAKLFMVHNGTVLPVSLDDVVASPRADDLVFMGGDNPAKGADDVVRLWGELQGRGFGGTLHWFGGVGAAFADRVRQAPGADRIILYGRRPRSEIFAVALRCKVLLMLSRADSFGMVTVEGMGTGCLPVAWDIATGTTEIVDPAYRHFAKLGDFRALAACVEAALATHAALFADATADIIARFSETAMGHRYEAFFDAILARPPVRRARAGERPPPYAPPRRYFQYLPSPVRAAIARITGKWPALGYAVRNLRGL